jgi:GNAT superfamily N-acetyltransferase
MLIIYAVLATIIIFLSVTIFIKVKYGFWALQPVFHVYNFNYMIWPPGIIRHDLPERNRYTNFKNIETIVFNELSDIKINQFVQFIKLNYLQNKDNVFAPEKQNVVSYFNSHHAKSFYSFYTEDEMLIDLKKGTTIEDNKLIGVITSRPLHIVINIAKDAIFDAYYVDYLCVDKMYRKKGIAQQMIQTHEYNQRHLNKKIVVSLFKREDELTGIVPLCVYKTFGFQVKKWSKPNMLHGMYKLLEITPQNFHFLTDFLKVNSSQFDIIINTEYSNLIELLKSKNIFIYVIMIGHDIKYAYFYRKSCTFIEKRMEVLSCFASIKGMGTEEEAFVQGFKISFWKTADDNNFGFAAIESISHNDVIISNLLLKTKPLVISPTAYFFYNFAYPTFQPNKVLILN